MGFSSKLFLVVGLLFVCQPALAEKRVALVVGNSNYKNAAALPNPANDAAAIAATLRGAGFDIVEFRTSISKRRKCGGRCEISPIKPATPT